MKISNHEQGRSLFISSDCRLTQLTKDFGKGFSEDNLGRMKNFYILYSPSISATPLRKLQAVDSKSMQIPQTASEKLQTADDKHIKIAQTLPVKSPAPEFHCWLRHVACRSRKI
jgi:hypothetical protein